MNTFRTTIIDGHVHVPVSADMPNGTQVEVHIVPLAEQIGIDESHWKTDEAAMKEWDEWLSSIEPIDFTPPNEFDQQFHEYNMNAVRKQMFGEQRE